MFRLQAVESKVLKQVNERILFIAPFTQMFSFSQSKVIQREGAADQSNNRILIYSRYKACSSRT